MAVVMTGGEEKPQMLHDFLGMSCEENRAVGEEVEGGGGGGGGVGSGRSDLGSERRGMSNSEVFHFHGRKNAIPEPEASNTISGRKRSNLDYEYMSLRDRMLPLAPESSDTFRLLKMLGKEVVGEHLGRTHDTDTPFSTQLPPRHTSSLILPPPASSRPESFLSKWERSMPVNPGTVVQYPSRLGQSGTYMDRLSSSYSHRDASAGGTLFSQVVADEGSRTGIKGSGMWGVANPSGGALDRYSTAVLPYSNRPRAPQTKELDSSKMPSRNNIASTTRQMTIFYAGQAHVFDDVHQNKADVIMALAGSNGGSWSTTFSPRKSNAPIAEVKMPKKEFDLRSNSQPLIIQGNLNGGLRQASRIPVANDPRTVIPESLQGGHVTGDARLATQSAEPEIEG